MTKGRSLDRGDEAALASPTSADIDALRADNAALRARIAELEQEQMLHRAIIDNSPTIIFAKDADGRYIMANRSFEALFGMCEPQLRGKTDFDRFSTDVAESLRENDRTAIAAAIPIEVEEVVQSEKGLRTHIAIKFPIYDPDGGFIAVCGMATDITERKRAEEEPAALHHRIIDAQRASLKELSTPLIPLAEGVLAMPLVGAIDSARAQQIMEALLDGIATRSAKTAILDLTGIKNVDMDVANALIRAAKAARLLGAEVVLTGIGPAVAASLIELGVELHDVITVSTLQAGIAHALKRSLSSLRAPVR